MLKNLFPQNHKHYSSLSVLGPILNQFIEFLMQSGYPSHVIRTHVRATEIIDQRLRQRRCNSVDKITRSILQSCAPPFGHAHEDKKAAAVTRLLRRFFNKEGIFTKEPLTPIEKKIDDYCMYLKNVRCLSPASLHQRCVTASLFLNRFIKYGGLEYLPKLTLQDIEDFVRDTGNRVSRRTLEGVIGRLRSFLRFLEIHKEILPGLSTQIDTPRIYREEQLPRSVDWENVCTLLKSIDRSSPLGKRDYAILLLITTYGLRSGEIVSLKLENVEWRKNRLQVFQSKTGTMLLLPLTDAVGNSILDYLRYGRPSVPYREIFVRHRAPMGTLTFVKDILQRRVKNSGLSVPIQGAHSIRHSYAVHLLRRGISLKTIGDLLGHRNFSSTGIYIRLNIDDLRTVPLSFPKQSVSIKGANL